MALSTELLLLCSQMKSGMYGEWETVPEVKGCLDGGVSQAVDDRLAFARQFADWAQALAQPGASDMDARNSVSRAYYACHHAVRALCLFRNNQDQADHREAIKVFSKIVGAEGGLRACLKVADADEIYRQLTELIDQRHLADYYPYGTSDAKAPPLAFIAEAPAIAQGAVDFVTAVDKFVRDRRGGQI